MDPFFDFQYPENLMDRASWTRNEQRAMQKLERLKILYDTGFHHDAGMAWLMEQLNKYTWELREHAGEKKIKKLPDAKTLMMTCFLKFGGRRECLDKVLNEKNENIVEYSDPEIVGYYKPDLSQEFRMKCAIAQGFADRGLVLWK